MKTANKQGFVFAAAAGTSVGVAVTAMRAFETNLGTPLGLVAGTALSAAVAYVIALSLRYFFNRFSKSAE